MGNGALLFRAVLCDQSHRTFVAVLMCIVRRFVAAKIAGCWWVLGIWCLGGISRSDGDNGFVFEMRMETGCVGINKLYFGMLDLFLLSQQQV